MSTPTTPSAPPTQPSPAMTRARTAAKGNNNQTNREQDDEDVTGNRNRKKDRNKSMFKGSVEDMDGHVFQLYEESKQASQFTETVEKLKSYARINLDHAPDLDPLFDTEPTEPNIAKPSAVAPDQKNSLEYIVWKGEAEEWGVRTRALRNNKSKLIAVALEQCSKAVKPKLESLVDFQDEIRDCNLLWVLTKLKNICHSFEETDHRATALNRAKMALFSNKQQPHQSDAQYYIKFKELLAIVEAYGGQIHDGTGAASTADKLLIDSMSTSEANLYMRDIAIASLFVLNADSTRYSQLQRDLHNANTVGRNEYPQSLVNAYNMLLSYKTEKKAPAGDHSQRGSNAGRGGRGFNRGGRNGRGDSGNTGCGDSSISGRTGSQHLTLGFLFTQDEHFPNGIPGHYILLDSDSTISIFNNLEMLSNVQETDEPLQLTTNGGGYQETYLKGETGILKDVWYNPESIANILSLAEVRKVCRVTMDSDQEAALLVHRSDGSILKFREHPSGLYLHDTTDVTHTSPAVAAYSCLQTVEDNKQAYTKREVEQADEARRLHHLLARPGVSKLLQAIRDNQINNCPVTEDDVRRAEHIYGKDVAFLKGKTTAKPAKDHADSVPAISVPPEIISAHPRVTLCADLFYVLGVKFSLSTSRHLHYISCRQLEDRSKPQLRQSLRDDIVLYNSRGFTVTDVRADGEYAAIQDQFPSVTFDICAPDDHEGEAERAIRTIKEGVRATIHGLPYKRIPKLMVVAIVEFVTKSINSLLHADGVSQSLSPHSLVTGKPKPDYHKMKLELGEYVQVYDGTSNDTKARTMGAIALNQTGNANGDYYFLNLVTGRKIHRRSWTALPISEIAISRVEALAFNEGMPLVSGSTFLEEYDPDSHVDDEYYDKDFVPEEHPDLADDHALTTDAYSSSNDESSDDDDDDDFYGDVGHVPMYDDATGNERTQPIIDNTPGAHNTAANQPQATPTCAPDETTVRTSNARPATNARTAASRSNVNAQEEERGKEEREKETHSVEQAERRTGRARARKKPSRYNCAQHSAPTAPSTQHGDINNDADERAIDPALQKAITGMIFTQMSAKKGIEKHGKVAEDALKREFEQFRDKEVFEPLDAFTMSDEHKKEALNAISVIKEKRCGKIKGRTCADGSKQRDKYAKEDTGSPTISTDALFLTVLVDAHEGRDVATADVPGAYLNADMKDFISLRLTGKTVKLMCDVNPDFTPYTVYENKTLVLYVRCIKAVYGCVMSGLLWYDLFSTTLEKMGFEVNPYDYCVANATIKGSQCTVAWYVDDAKISHKDATVVSQVITELESKFGKLTVTRGRKQQFLGMDIIYREDGTASITMSSYIDDAIRDCGMDIVRNQPSPCASSLFKPDPSSPLLNEAELLRFHRTVARLLYIATRARTDILLAIGYLCGRVKCATLRDQARLRRLLEYLRGTRDLDLRLGADSLSSCMTWVDASFAIHPDMRSHTGGVISFGRGGIICKSSRQKITTKSSTEAEVVGASDYLPHTLYVKMFMEAQGYPIKDATFFQDNESAIKMEKHGKASCGQRSRHINIRYFFITDRSKSDDVRILHCPTACMLADFLTKPLQGALFRKFRSVLLGHEHVSILSPAAPSPPLAERVENGNHGESCQVDKSCQAAVNDVSAYRFTKMNKLSHDGRSHSLENDPENIPI